MPRCAKADDRGVQGKIKPRAWEPDTGPMNDLPPHPWSGFIVLHAADQAVRRLFAEDLPVLRSATTSKETFCPSLSPGIPARSTALMCTKTSLQPSSGWMKPKPFWPLNHFTVPCVIYSSFSYVCLEAARQRRQFVRDFEESRQSDAGCAARPSRSAEARLVQCGESWFRSQGSLPPAALFHS
jgi:hypothetical protein